MKKPVFPDAFAGNFNLLFITFNARHLIQLFHWMPYVADLSQDTPLQHYIFPLIPKSKLMARQFINGGMKSELPDWLKPENYVPLYVVRDEFCRHLAITDQMEVTVLLTDENGQILWRNLGSPTPEFIQQIREILEADSQPISAEL